MVALSSAPATPATKAQRSRYENIIEVATTMLVAGGDNLQMKDVAQQADVSLATLYRYFPSKGYLMLIVALRRYEAAFARVHNETASAPYARELSPRPTPRERVTHYLLREFRAQQREPRLTAALIGAFHETSREYGEVIERIDHLHYQVILRVAETDGPISPHLRRIIPLVLNGMGSATRRWLSGVISAADARFEIMVACRLLDITEAAVDHDLRYSADPT